jgi:hypothetical protein
MEKGSSPSHHHPPLLLPTPSNLGSSNSLSHRASVKDHRSSSCGGLWEEDLVDQRGACQAQAGPLDGGSM